MSVVHEEVVGDASVFPRLRSGSKTSKWLLVRTQKNPGFVPRGWVACMTAAGGRFYLK